MKSLKEYIMENKDEKVLAKGNVTTMSYDLEVKVDTNINQEIKDILIDKGWNFTIPEQRIIPYRGNQRVENNVDTPYTTAWKEGITPSESVIEFYNAIVAYNAKHALDKPAVLGRGHAFAVCDNVYDAVRIG